MKTTAYRPPRSRLETYAQAGFTIMETMIALGAAALILLIVFRAIPALQRGGHNNQRRQDIQTMLGAVSRYELNNSGKFPDDCGSGGFPACTSVGGSTPNDYFLRYVGNKMTFYEDNGNSGNHVMLRHLTSASHINQPPNNNLGTVIIYNYELCNETGGGAHFQGAGYSDVAALYAVENASAGGHAAQCQQL